MKRTRFLAAAAFVALALSTTGGHVPDASAQIFCPNNGTYQGFAGGNPPALMCTQLADTGEFNLGHLQTVSHALACLDGNDYAPVEYALWKSSSSVTASGMMLPTYISSAYTNWAIFSDNSARTQLLCSTVEPLGGVTSSGGALISSRAGAALPIRRVPEVRIRKTTPMDRTGTEPPVAVASCPSESVAVDGAGKLLWKSGRPPSKEPPVRVEIGQTAVQVTSDVRKMPNRVRADLEATGVCGPATADKVAGGTNLTDDLAGSPQADKVRAGGGGDLVSVGPGNDSVDGGPGNDRIRTGTGADSARGGTGEDVIEGGAGADRLSGGAARELLTGETGRDRFGGGAGNDRIVARDRRGGEPISCGPGEDFVIADRGDRVAKDCEHRYSRFPSRPSRRR